MTQQRLLTLDQAAEQCALSVDTLRRAIRVRELAHVRVGRVIRLRPEALEAWIGRKTVTSRRGVEA